MDVAAPIRAADDWNDAYQDDYIPNPKAKRERVVRKSDAINSGPVYIENVEYRSAEEQAKKTENRAKRIQEAMKQIVLAYSHKLKVYKQAKGWVEAATSAQLGRPDSKLHKAIQIVQKGPPITKEKARQMAVKQVMYAECR